MSCAWSRWALRLREARDGAVALRFQRLDLSLRQLQRRLRAPKRGLLLVQLGGPLLVVLNGAITRLGQMLVSHRLLLREHQCRLRLIHLRLVGADLCLLHLELRVDVLDAGLRGRDLRLGLLERDAIIAVVDAGDHVASGDVLVVGDRDGGDIAGHLWGERSLPRRDEGIVGRLEMLGVVQVDIAAAQGRGEKHRTDGGDNRATQQAVPALLAGCLRLALRPAGR